MNNEFLNWVGEETEAFSQASFTLLPDGNIQMTLLENGRKKQRYIQDYVSVSFQDSEKIKRYDRIWYKLLWSSDLWTIPDNLHLFVQKNSDNFQNYQDMSEVKWNFNRWISISWKQAMKIEASEGREFYFIKSSQLHPEITQEVMSIKKILQDLFTHIGAGK